jgi:hypothetical protein
MFSMWIQVTCRQEHITHTGGCTVSDIKWYLQTLDHTFITESDILNDVFEYASPEKHDEFLEWAGEALGVTFTFNKHMNMYVVGERRES